MRDLLLLLCRYPFEEKNRETLSKLIGEVEDWPEMVKLINAHGIIALATYNIKEAGLVKEIPGEAMTVLENGYMQSVVRNSWLTERWKEVNTILSGAGIKHVLLKGMALEHTLYGSKGLRQMTDNDILIRKEEALAAWYLLQQYDFTPGTLKSPLHKKIITEIGKHLPVLTKDGYSVDIHYRLFNKAEANKILTSIIDNSINILIAGAKGYVLQKGIQILFLKEHLQQHIAAGDFSLRLYTDLEMIEPGSAPYISAKFIENPKQRVSFKKKGDIYRNYFYSMPKKDRLRYLLGDVFPSLNWMKNNYKCNGVKAMLYYPFRLGKLVWLI
jgi:hypothetical protein